jgi:hypothetical protein
MTQQNAGIQAGIAINIKDDDRRDNMKNAQKAIAIVMCGKEESLALKKRE